MDPEDGRFTLYQLNGVHQIGAVTWIGGSTFYAILMISSVMIKWLAQPVADNTSDLDEEATPKFGFASGFGGANAEF